MAAVLEDPIAQGLAQPDGQELRFADGSTMHFRPDPDANAFTVSTAQFNIAVEALNKAAAYRKIVERDTTLSAIGKAARMETAGDELIQTIAKAGARIDDMEATANANEAKLFAPPPLEPGDAVSYLRDQELRTWLDKLPVKKQSEVLSAMHRGEHPNLAVAILRSPIPTKGFEHDMALAAFQAVKAREQPGMVKHIAAGRRSIEWGRRQLTALAAISRRTTKADDQRIKRAAGDIGGLSIFGIRQENP